MIHKTLPIKIEQRTKDGGRITISTSDLDRDRDRVIPGGARIENYLKNPVVQWGHSYHEPWSTIGKTTALEITPDGITADFELRPPANENDPQNIVRLLWEGEWIRTASIGFQPLEAVENEDGGRDFNEWELLEWSLVPVPANQAALRLAVKALDGEPLSQKPPEKKTAENPPESPVEFVETRTDDPSLLELKPYPNEHACRLRDPGDFQPDSFRRVSREHEGKEYNVIMGRLEGEDALTEQAYRYPKDTWEASEARAHCNTHDGSEFSPASDTGKTITNDNPIEPHQDGDEPDTDPPAEPQPTEHIEPEDFDADVLAALEQFISTLESAMAQ